jgi:hypothetical protein
MNIEFNTTDFRIDFEESDKSYIVTFHSKSDQSYLQTTLKLQDLSKLTGMLEALIQNED